MKNWRIIIPGMPVWVLVCLFLGGIVADAMEPFRIQVVDSENDWPVPLIELRTVNDIRFLSDNAGVIAFNEPDLMDKEVWFHVSGHGYSVEKDGFGYQGVRLTPESGGSYTLKVHRDMISRCVGRLTGEGLFAESKKCGLRMDWKDSGCVGCDSVQIAPYKGKIFWAWGDTSLSRYPLGVFHTTAATTPLPGEVAFPSMPPVCVQYNHYRNKEGDIAGVATFPGEGPTWLSGTTVLRDAKGEEKLCAVYSKIKPPLRAYEVGLCVWSDTRECFEIAKVVWKEDSGKTRPMMPDGHPALWRDESGVEWMLFGDPLPRLRCKANYEAWLNSDTWEKVEIPNTLVSAMDGSLVRLHTGSIQWSNYRERWVTVFVEVGGTPSHLGEVWYAEAASPLGPWGKAVKILTHDHYTFYNPRLHPELVDPGSSFLLFEGTYTKEFERNAFPTARYNYNQMLYRLDLDDPRLEPTHAIQSEWKILD